MTKRDDRMATRAYQRLVDADRTHQQPEEQARIARNGLRQVVADGLQAAGDQVVNARTVLPWALSAVGAPAFLIALLVPIRESGSMLPQAAMAPVLQRSADRRRFWLWGAAGQAIATAGMALLIATSSGWVAGVGIVTCLAFFALSRSLNSLAGKDVLGRTVPKGERGQISGLTAMLAGAVAITLGLGLRLGGDDTPSWVLAVLLGGAAVAWIAALVVFAGVRDPLSARASSSPRDTDNTHGGESPPEPRNGSPREADDTPAEENPAESRNGSPREADDTPAEENPAGSRDASANQVPWWRDSWQLLRDDAPFRRFVLARGLLLVSALAPPFVVTLAAQQSGHSLAGLGPFVIAQGLAGLLGGRLAGRLADRSSQQLMVWGAVAASGTILAFLLLRLLLDAPALGWLAPVVFLLLALTHVSVRVARKTYVVDLAGEDRRTRYVAVSNTVMGALLLVVGALSSALALLGAGAALAFLAALGLVGAAVSRTLPEVSRRG